MALEYKKENNNWKYFKEEFHGSFPVRKNNLSSIHSNIISEVIHRKERFF